MENAMPVLKTIPGCRLLNHGYFGEEFIICALFHYFDPLIA
jgi:hypothetical protein